MLPLETLYRQSSGFREEAIRRAEHARLVKLVVNARRFFRLAPRQNDANSK